VRPRWTGLADFTQGAIPASKRLQRAKPFEDTSRLARSSPPTEESYELWRWSRDSTGWKYRMHDEGLPLPTQRSDGTARCFCGEVITTKSMDEHIRAAHRRVAE
jgi:hypothetical protein